jgi:predicted acetyltransferase
VTTPSDDLRLRTATADDFEAVWEVLGQAFGEDLPEDSAALDRLVFEPDRNLVFVEGDTVVANAGVCTRDLTIPGAVVPGAHVTMVGVRPTHRRRGLLTRLMHRQLRDIREAGREPVALLWASEGRIYQRFGYGQASMKLALEIDKREVTLLPRVSTGAGRLHGALPAEARKNLIDVYERVRGQRTGWSSRDERWWDRILGDPPSARRGASAIRAALYEGAEGFEGYALWRAKSDWDETGPTGQTQVREVVTSTPQAYGALWGFLLSIDLARSVRYWGAAIDEPLLHLVNEPRRLGSHLGDALWVRVVDVPVALTARRYAGPLDTVIEVDDALLVENAGRWRLRTTGAGVAATCTPTSEPVDLSCDVSDLGAAYLGGVSLATLAAGGRVRELRPGALAAASTAFSWHRPPSTLEVF